MRFQTKGQAVFRVIVKRPYPESGLERAPLGLLRFRPLQLSDADADESNPMIAFGKLIGELHADLREDLLIEHVGPQGPLSQVGLESLETYLDPDRAEGRALSPCPEENVPGHIADRRFHLRPIRHVLVERPFDADRLRVGALLDRQLLDAPGDRPQPD